MGPSGQTNPGQDFTKKAEFHHSLNHTLTLHKQETPLSLSREKLRANRKIDRYYIGPLLRGWIETEIFSTTSNSDLGIITLASQQELTRAIICQIKIKREHNFNLPSELKVYEHKDNLKIL